MAVNKRRRISVLKAGGGATQLIKQRLQTTLLDVKTDGALSEELTAGSVRKLSEIKTPLYANDSVLPARVLLWKPHSRHLKFSTSVC